VGVVKVNKPSIGLEPWVPYGGVKDSGNDAYKRRWRRLFNSSPG